VLGDGSGELPSTFEFIQIEFSALYEGTARCVSHKGKTFVVYHKVTVFFACGRSVLHSAAVGGSVVGVVRPL